MFGGGGGGGGGAGEGGRTTSAGMPHLRDYTSVRTAGQHMLKYCLFHLFL